MMHIKKVTIETEEIGKKEQEKTPGFIADCSYSTLTIKYRGLFKMIECYLIAVWIIFLPLPRIATHIFYRMLCFPF